MPKESRIKKNTKHPAKGIMSPSSHAIGMHEFVLGLIIGGFLGGIGSVIATIIIKGMIKKHVKDDNHPLKLGAA